MKTIAICNLKGGVAKTVTTVNLAAILAKDHGKRVLVVDADSQANATEFFGGDPEKGRLSDLLRAPEPCSDTERIGRCLRSIQAAKCFNVDLLAADDSLMDLDLSSVKSESVDVSVLRLALRSSDAAKFWDFVLIDCPPAFNAAAAAALLASDEVLIPIKLDAFSLRGMGNLMRQIENMKKINPALRLLGVLPTMYYRSDKLAEALRMLRDFGLPVLDRIPRSPRVDDMTFAQTPLIESSPRSEACRAYRRLCEKIVRGGESDGV